MQWVPKTRVSAPPPPSPLEEMPLRVACLLPRVHGLQTAVPQVRLRSDYRSGRPLSALNTRPTDNWPQQERLFPGSKVRDLGWAHTCVSGQDRRASSASQTSACWTQERPSAQGPATRCDEMDHLAAILRILEPSQPITDFFLKIAAVWPVSYPRCNVLLFSCDFHRSNSI